MWAESSSVNFVNLVNYNSRDLEFFLGVTSLARLVDEFRHFRT